MSPCETELTRVFQARSNRVATEIVPGLLWLGGAADAQDAHQLSQRKIVRILNVADDVPNFHPSQFEYCNLSVGDFGQDVGISRVFDRAFAFLNEAVEKKEPVLVHCAAGVNRSPTIVVAYLMQFNKWTLQPSWDFVRKKRSISPLKGKSRGAS